MNILQRLFSRNKTQQKEYEGIGTDAWIRLLAPSVNNDESDYTTSWAWTCIKKRALVGSHFETIMCKVDRSGLEKEVRKHEFLDAISKVNIFNQSWNTLQLLIWQSLDTYSKAFVYVIKDLNGRVSNFMLLPTRNMQIVTQNGNQITGYKYVGRNTINFSLDEIIFINVPSILNPIDGNPLLSDSRHLYKLDNVQQVMEKSWYEHYDNIGLVIQIPAGINKEQKAAIQQVLQDKYSGASNAGLPLVVEGGVTVQRGVNSFKDFEITKNKEFVRDAICARFEVPKVLLGNTDKETFASVKTAEYVFLKHTIIPYSKFIKQPFEYFIKQTYGEEYCLEFEYPRQINPEDVRYISDAYTNGVITKNEYRAVLNYAEVDGGDEYNTNKPETTTQTEQQIGATDGTES